MEAELRLVIAAAESEEHQVEKTYCKLSPSEAKMVRHNFSFPHKIVSMHVHVCVIYGLSQKLHLPCPTYMYTLHGPVYIYNVCVSVCV